MQARNCQKFIQKLPESMIKTKEFEFFLFGFFIKIETRRVLIPFSTDLKLLKKTCSKVLKTVLLNGLGSQSFLF